MTQPKTVTGRREDRGGVVYVVLDRTFNAPIEQVWAAVTDPTRMERWVGTWTGDPDDGYVDFFMTAEGEGPASTMEILDCEPPQRVCVRSQVPGAEAVWIVAMDLAEADGITTLTFGQSLPDPTQSENIGPGWEYYLDRLVLAEQGGDVAEVVWENYYPVLSEPYRDMFA